ncbi:hypothetical protein MMC21_005116 [Puttea exsequens]|nr:hypothetical protein [Puttea exsequens]
MLRRSTVILAASLVVLSALDPAFGLAAAAPTPAHEEVERPRLYKKEVKRFVFSNANGTTAGPDFRGASPSSREGDFRGSSKFENVPPFVTSTPPVVPPIVPDPIQEAAVAQETSAAPPPAATTKPSVVIPDEENALVAAAQQGPTSTDDSAPKDSETAPAAGLTAPSIPPPDTNPTKPAGATTTAGFGPHNEFAKVDEVVRPATTAQAGSTPPINGAVGTSVAPVDNNPAAAAAVTGAPAPSSTQQGQGTEIHGNDTEPKPSITVKGEQVLDAVQPPLPGKTTNPPANAAHTEDAVPISSTDVSPNDSSFSLPDAAVTGGSPPDLGVVKLPGGAAVTVTNAPAPIVKPPVVAAVVQTNPAGAVYTNPSPANAALTAVKQGGVDVVHAVDQPGKAAATSAVGGPGAQISVIPGQNPLDTPPDINPQNSQPGPQPQNTKPDLAGAATTAAPVIPGQKPVVPPPVPVGAITSPVAAVVSGVADIIDHEVGAVTSALAPIPGTTENNIDTSNGENGENGENSSENGQGANATENPPPALPTNPEDVLNVNPAVPTGNALYTAVANALGPAVPSGMTMLPNGQVVSIADYQAAVNYIPTRLPQLTQPVQLANGQVVNNPLATLEPLAAHRTQAPQGHFTLPGGGVLANPFVTKAPEVGGHFTAPNGLNAGNLGKAVSQVLGHFTAPNAGNPEKAVSEVLGHFTAPNVAVGAAISQGAVEVNPTLADKLNPMIPLTAALEQGAVVPKPAVQTGVPPVLHTAANGDIIPETAVNPLVPVTQPNGQIVSASPGAVVPVTGLDGHVMAATAPVPQITGSPVTGAPVVGSQTLSDGRVVPVTAGQITGSTTLPNGSVVPLSATGAPAVKTLPNGQVAPVTNGAAAIGLTTLPNGSVVPIASIALASHPPGPNNVLNAQVFPTDGKGPFTQEPTGYDSATAEEVPTSIIAGPSTMPSSQSAGYGPTGLPSGIPLVLYPQTGPVKRPENTELIQLGFRYPLNYDFVWTHDESQKQIFKYLPIGISFALAIELENVTMQTLRAWDTTQDLHFITTLALAWIPNGLVDSLGLLVQTPTSRFYHNPDQSTKTLLDMINNALPISADNSTDSGDIPYGAIPTNTNNPNDNGAPISNSIGASPPVRASSAGIAIGVACGAAAYGAAMFFVARRYRKRRQSHMRSPSMFSSPVMSHAGGEPGAGTALMSGGMVDRSMSPYHDDDGRAGAGSRGSGRSGSSRHQISAPVMAENSLGWN